MAASAPMRGPRLYLAGLVGALAFLGVTALDAGNPYAIEPPSVEQTRAFRYAKLDSEGCLAQLDARGFPYKLVGPTGDVETPLRFTGPIRGIVFDPTPRAEEDPVAHSSIADCRLALAVDDLAMVLAKHGVVEVGYLSMFRTKGLGAIKPGRRHPSGLAIDVSTIKLKDGREYSVRYDFHGRIGAKTCGEGAAEPTEDVPEAWLWRDIVCDLADKQSFNLVLTPHYDWGHADHLHLEVRTGIRWFLVQ